MRKLSKLLVLLLIGGLAFELAAQEYTYTSAATNMHRRNAELNMTKRWLDEYFDVQFDWVVTENQFEKLNVLLAAGEIPDMIAMRLNPVQLSTYADQGVLAELPVDTIREAMPEYYAHIESFGDPRVWKYGEIDGKHMGLPIISPWNVYRRGIAWNAQWLYNVGITKVPETLEEYEEAFLKFRHEDPNRSGSKDTYAFTAPGDQEGAPAGFFQEIFGAHGTFPFNWIEKDGKLQFGFTDPGTKEALALLADWYAREIIDPEWVTEIGRTDGANDISWKFANEKIGYVSSLGSDDSEWDGGGHLNRKWHLAHPEHRSYIYTDPDCWPDDCAGKGHYSIIAFTEVDPDAHASVTDYHPYVAGEPPIGPRGDAGMSVRGLLPSYVVFGRQLERDEDKLHRLLEVLNAIATDRELYYSAALGCFAGDTTKVCEEATALGVGAVGRQRVWQLLRPGRGVADRPAPPGRAGREPGGRLLDQPVLGLHALVQREPRPQRCAAADAVRHHREQEHRGAAAEGGAAVAGRVRGRRQGAQGVSSTRWSWARRASTTTTTWSRAGAATVATS